MQTKPVAPISLTDRTRSSTIAVLRAATEQLERLSRGAGRLVTHLAVDR
jgi:hypothetical protein